MDKATEAIFKKRVTDMPESVQLLLVRPTFDSSIRVIAEKHRLPEEKLESYETLIILVLLAFEDMGDFEELLMRELLIPGSVAASIVHDIENTIFAEVRSDLLKIYAEREKYEKELAQQELGKPTQKPSGKEPLPEPLPSYKKPLTETPTYKEDPYREIPR